MLKCKEESSDHNFIIILPYIAIICANANAYRSLMRLPRRQAGKRTIYNRTREKAVEVRAYWTPICSWGYCFSAFLIEAGVLFAGSLGKELWSAKQKAFEAELNLRADGERVMNGMSKSTGIRPFKSPQSSRKLHPIPTL